MFCTLNLDVVISVHSPNESEIGSPLFTLSRGLGVLRIRTAHCMSVVGGFSVGTTGSSSC